MADYSDSIDRHYAPEDISARIVEKLRSAGKDLDALTRDDVAPFDEFHGGGRESTRELGKFAGLERGMEVLDVGSGVGGPARTLTAEFGCRVTGIDLTEEFCRAAEMLTGLVGMAGQVQFRQGDAVDMPFDEASFDVVWSQNTLMNIEDKAQLVREVHRVLRPGGLFAFETIVAGDVSEIHFPVFWADSPSLNFLVRPEQLRQLLSASDLAEHAWEDTTLRSIEMARKRLAAIRKDGPPPLGLGVIVPMNVPKKLENSLRNIEEGRTTTVQAVYVRAI